MNRFRRFERDEGDQTTIGIALAPLIDVVFLLLIFFMVTTTFTSRPGLKILLPRSGGEVEVPAERWVVSINAEGTLFLNEQEIPLGRLTARLSEDPKPVDLRADESVSHGQVVRVMDRIRQSGIENININTRPLPPDES